MLEITRHYLLSALEGTPEVLAHLLRDLSPSSPVWDRRPDPDRFTLREITAHLADWDPVFVARIDRIRAEAEPALEQIDPGHRAIEQGYDRSDPQENLARFQERRKVLFDRFRSLEPEEWGRRGIRANSGPMSIEELAAMIAGHDGYHLRQVVQWLEGGPT